jgi:hypothetical protein
MVIHGSVEGGTRRVSLFWALLLFAVSAAPHHAVAGGNPATVREFLSRFAGKEILIVNLLEENLQFDDADSLTRYVVVLDSVASEHMIVHRAAGSDRRSFEYPLAEIRRITYLFDGKPYPRIVIETQ